ncbi:MAG: hypothetical protein HC818_05870 [Synechococcaceae cyanobacterium RM1_1_27]|nr:hypothetical protein [Synechococcaceae cyanobacterium SM2_3_2]NJO86135.1 hypothetical protein [Synechococcaceae cyanobacterium RM1_1_27]
MPSSAYFAGSVVDSPPISVHCSSVLFICDHSPQRFQRLLPKNWGFLLTIPHSRDPCWS